MHPVDTKPCADMNNEDVNNKENNDKDKQLVNIRHIATQMYCNCRGNKSITSGTHS